MPEGHGASAAGRGRPQSRRALVTVVSIVVLLVAAIAFANRGNHNPGVNAAGSGNTGAGTGNDSAGSAGSGGGKDGDAPATAPSGVSPVGGKTAGIPTGFAHDAQGAQSAATNYSVVLGGVGMFAADSRHRIVSTIYAPQDVGASQSQLDRAYTDPGFLQRIGLQPDGTAPRGTTFVSRTTPVGAKLVAFHGDTATVSVWYSSLFGLAGVASANPVIEGWYTNTLRLTWASGDWKVTDLQQKDGPTPVGRDQAASSAQDMSDAVNGFGGFTYAR